MSADRSHSRQPSDNVSIHQLNPELDASHTFIGVVCLLWPYSSSKRSLSLLLREKDVVPPPRRNEVRLALRGHAAVAAARSGITIGDELVVRLVGVEWKHAQALDRTPGRSIDWDLCYSRQLSIQIIRQSGAPLSVEVDRKSPTPEPIVSSPVLQQTEHEQLASSPVLPLRLTGLASSWASPMRLSTHRFSGALSLGVEDEEDFVDSDRQKRFKFGRESHAWHFAARTPSPEKPLSADQDISEDLDALSDEAVDSGPEAEDNSVSTSRKRKASSDFVPSAPNQTSLPTEDAHPTSATGTPSITMRDNLEGREPPPLPSEFSAPQSGIHHSLTSAGLESVDITAPEPLPLQPLAPSFSFTESQTPGVFAYPDDDAGLIETTRFPTEIDSQSILPPYQLIQDPASNQNVFLGDTAQPPEPDQVGDGLVTDMPAIWQSQEAEADFPCDSHPIADLPVSGFDETSAAREEFASDEADKLVGLGAVMVRQPAHELLQRAGRSVSAAPTRGSSAQDAIEIGDSESEEESGEDIKEGIEEELEEESEEEFQEEIEEVVEVEIESEVEEESESEVEEEMLKDSDRFGSNQPGQRPHRLDTAVHESGRSEHDSEEESSPGSESLAGSTHNDIEILENAGRPTDSIASQDEDLVESSAKLGKQSPRRTVEEIDRTDSQSVSPEASQNNLEKHHSPPIPPKYSTLVSGTARLVPFTPQASSLRELSPSPGPGNDTIATQERTTRSGTDHVVRQVETPMASQAVPELHEQPETAAVPAIEPTQIATATAYRATDEHPDLVAEQRGSTSSPIKATSSPQTSDKRPRDRTTMAYLDGANDQTEASTTELPSEDRTKLQQTQLVVQRSESEIRPPDSHSSPEKEAEPVTLEQDEQVALAEPEKQKKTLDKQREASDEVVTVQDAPKQETELVSGFRTPLAYFVSLASIPGHFNGLVDVLAVVVSTTRPSRSRGGPRDFYQALFLSDPSISSAESSYIRVEVYRPTRDALPQAVRGDAVLLRNFKVQSQKRKLMLLSGESSAWAVFGAGSDGQYEARGPPVELGNEEREHARKLRRWWELLTKKAKAELEDQVAMAKRPGRAAADSPAAANKGTMQRHLLRDGASYSDENGLVTHELRNGATYSDK